MGPLRRTAATLALALLAGGVSAQQAPPPATAPGLQSLSPVIVTARPIPQAMNSGPVSPEIQRFEPPGTLQSIGRQQIEELTNTVDTEDALAYLPSLLLRKRDFGDTQATLATRTWGINSSARSLVYVDDVPISALISNNNTSGAPRWGMLAPGAVDGIDVLYGPFAAEYPGNSMGAVVLITTLLPEHFQASVEQTEALQSFDLYETQRSYTTSSTTATLGDRNGPLSWLLSANREDSFDQPLYFVTSGAVPAGTAGAIPAVSKTGTTANVVGAGGIQHAILDNLNGRFALDLTGWLRANYSLGYFDNRTTAADQTYLVTGSGAPPSATPTFGGVSGFAADAYGWRQRHLMNALSFKTHTNGAWDWEAIVTRYDYLQDLQRNPAGVLSGEAFTSRGYLTRMDGTHWSTEDLKGIWRPGGIRGAHEVSAGVHRDEYVLDNPTYESDDWTSDSDSSLGNGTLYSEGRGRTVTDALWAQDAWRFAPHLQLTTGARLESWRADEGFNLAGRVAARQPDERSSNLSPKATLAWQIDSSWDARLSFGEAYRYPTVSELYQIVATGPTYSIPNPNLAPEHDYSEELAVEWQTGSTRLHLSLFQENTLDALISQMNLLDGTYTTTFQNVHETLNRGVELVAQRADALIMGLDLSNSVTYVDSVMLSDATFHSPAGTTATGKRVPYVPEWRDTAQVAYHMGERLALSLAARYQSKVYSTLDDTDSVLHVFGAFDPFFVVDAHVHYRVSRSVQVDVGVDNLFNERYFEYHPFPMRTYIGHLQLQF